MPKKILIESAVHHLSVAARRFRNSVAESHTDQAECLVRFVNSWSFEPRGKQQLLVRWSFPKAGSCELSFKNAALYTRGDNARAIAQQELQGLLHACDAIEIANQEVFDRLLRKLLDEADIGL